MRQRLFLLYLTILAAWPLTDFANQDLQNRFETSLGNARSLTNVEVKFLDSMTIRDPVDLKIFKITNGVYSHTFLYSYLACGQKYQATSKLIAGTGTNLGAVDESAFDGRWYRAYSAQLGRSMTINMTNRPLEGLNSMNPLVTPFTFFKPSREGGRLRLLTFTDITSGKLENGFTLPPAVRTNGLLEASWPGFVDANQKTTWKMMVDETNDCFAPSVIELINPGFGVVVVDHLLNYTNLGNYQFPSRIEWTEETYPPTSPPTVKSSGTITLISARIPEPVEDSVFELKDDETLADSIWDNAKQTFVRTAPGYAPTKACVPYSGEKIYDETADAAKQIDAGLAMAKQGRKRLLLEFGANWSDPCHQLNWFLTTNQDVAGELGKDYVVVLVDVNKGHNRTIEMNYGHPIHNGLPAITLLDADGKLLTTKIPSEWVESGNYVPEKLTSFLQQWAAGKDR